MDRLQILTFISLCQAFGNYFFELFDDDRSGSVSILELTGGLQKLASA